MEQFFYIVRHKDEDVCRKSSSGGAFTAITDAWFSEYGDKAVVYGCAFDENLSAVHIRATDKECRNLMRGSKYISSELSGSFKLVEEDLKKGFYVIFSGTPCQIAGLKAFLRVKKLEETKNLLTIDVVCHGVGSERFFEDYISYFEKKNKSRAISCNFRAKSRPGKLQDMEIVFENGKKYNASSTKYDWFYSVYNVKNLILRPSCYSCKFAKLTRESDITVSDSWGSFREGDNKEKSMIIANTQAGFAWVQEALLHMDYVSVDGQRNLQERLHTPASKPSDYDTFWEIYKTKGYLSAQRYVGNNTLKGKLRTLIVTVINKMHLTEVLKKIKF